MKHGLSSYANRGCRCDVCRAAMTTYRAAHRRRVRNKVPPEVPHGVNSTYTNYSCRCQACCEAAAARKRAYRDRKEKEAPAPTS